MLSLILLTVYKKTMNAVITKPVFLHEALNVHRHKADLPIEEPLEIRINGTPYAVIMRTPGNEMELAAGCREKDITRVQADLRIPAGNFYRMLNRMLEFQEMYGSTRAAHAAGIFYPGGEPIVVRENAGRHNALDKAIGHALMQVLTASSSEGYRGFANSYL